MTEESYHQLMQVIKDRGYDYQMVDHPAATTTEAADRYIEGHPGVRTKTMFMKAKKHRYVMLIMDDHKRLDFHRFQDLTGLKRVSMASVAATAEKLGLAPGIVSPFGLMNDVEKDVSVYFDKEMLKEPILTFHPNVNTHTIFLNTEDVLDFVTQLGFVPQVIDL